MKRLSLRDIEVEEMIRKDVKASGNGGAVWVPKRWRGENVIIVLPRKKSGKRRERK